MELNKKKVLDELYLLRQSLAEKAHRENRNSFDVKDNVCLNNLAIGRSNVYENSCKELDEVITKIIDF